MTIHQTIPLSGLLCLAVIFDFSAPVARSQSLFDGFNAYCTSNKDYTGSCTNVETSKDYSCTLIPGSLIDCLSDSGYEFQCLFASQHTQGQATFYCDAQTEELLYQEEQAGDTFKNVLQNSL
jgi:hypothetical protein